MATGGPLSSTEPTAPVDVRLFLLQRPERASTDQLKQVDKVGEEQADQVDQVDRVEKNRSEEDEDPEGRVDPSGPAWRRGDT